MFSIWCIQHNAQTDCRAIIELLFFVWGCCIEWKMNVLQRIQNRAATIVTKAPVKRAEHFTEHWSWKKSQNFSKFDRGWSNAPNISLNISTCPIAPSQGYSKNVKMNEIVRRNVWQGGQTHTTFHRTLRTMEKFGEVFELRQTTSNIFEQDFHHRTRWSNESNFLRTSMLNIVRWNIRHVWPGLCFS